MNSGNNFQWGAKIERGEITAAKREADGASQYDIKSIDRPGVTANGVSCDQMLAPGAKVYFFLFDDGHGMILGVIA